MKYFLPTRRSLRTFEAVCRLRSYSRAGEELHLTQSAVSKQIKQLEDFLDRKLFIRKGHGIYLTKEAEILRQGVTEAFDLLDKTIERIAPSSLSQETLHIDIVPALNTGWLIPRLDDFHQKHKAIRINIFSGDGKVDQNNSADIIFRSAKAPDIFSEDYEVQDIMSEQIVLVGSPILWKKHQSKTLAQLLPKVTLLVHSTRPDMWDQYLTSAQLGDLETQSPIHCEHFYMLVSAAKQNLGIALVPERLVQEEIRKKELLALPFSQEFESPYRYYMGIRKDKKALPKIQHFLTWLPSLIKNQKGT